MKKLSLIIFIFTQLIINIYSQAPQWRTLPNSPTANSRNEDVFFINSNTGWVCGYEKIYKTTNGGATWATQLTAPMFMIRSIGFVDSLRGWAGLLPYIPTQDTTILYSTTNGGANWVLVPKENFPNPKPTGICGIWVINSTTIYAGGRWDGPARYIKTTNSGLNWISKDLSPDASCVIDFYFTGPDSGFAVGGIDTSQFKRKAVVLFTSNGGNNWVTRFTHSDTSQWGWKISFPSPSTGYVSIENIRNTGPVYFLKTTNSGLNWEYKQFIAGYYDEEGIGFVNNSTGWIGGTTGPTYQTTDGGDTWSLAGFGQRINRFRFLSDTLAYAVGQRVYCYSRNPIGIQTISSEIPKQFSLSQNYPNPFNPTTKIQFALPKSSFATLVVYDALGREVETLVNEQLTAGTYEADWNADKFSSGVYYYKVTAGEYTETRKMVLIK